MTHAPIEVAILEQFLSHPTVRVALFAPKSPWAIEFLM